MMKLNLYIEIWLKKLEKNYKRKYKKVIKICKKDIDI